MLRVALVVRVADLLGLALVALALELVAALGALALLVPVALRLEPAGLRPSLQRGA